MLANMCVAVSQSTRLCSMSTVSHANPDRARNREAVMLPSDNQVPTAGFPSRSARFTGLARIVFSLCWNRISRASILFEATAWRRPAIRLSRQRWATAAVLDIVGGNYLVVVMEMKVLVFRVSLWLGIRDRIRVAHEPTQVYGIGSHSSPSHQGGGMLPPWATLQPHGHGHHYMRLPLAGSISPAGCSCARPAYNHDMPVGGKPDALLHVLVALAAVLVLGRSLGLLFRYVGQPPVIGEVVGGILLGPSFLTQVWPEAASFILPPAVAPYLGVMAQLGVIFYMFLVGLELDLGVLRKRAQATLVISHASIVVPFLMGTALAWLLYPEFAGGDVSFTSFALFVGIALSITAFPVLARILTDRRIQKTPLGILALGCAAANDVIAWCLLAFVVGVAQAKVSGAFFVLVLTVAYVGFFLLVVRPTAARVLARLDDGQLTSGVLALILAAVLLSALATEAIGIHAIFGAFLLGAVIPHDSALAQTLARKLEDVVAVMLLPAFFAFTGMRTQIGLVSGWEAWLMCGLIVLVATAGKFGGTILPARLSGLGWRDAMSLGVLMNTRGMMELIALNIGLDLNVLSPALFAMMVLMALATTMATTPVLELLAPRSPTPQFQQAGETSHLTPGKPDG